MKYTFFSFLFLFSNLSFSTEYVSGSKVFIDGYDPVAYQVQNKAIKGNPAISYTYDGVKILFSSEKNKKKFNEHPERYMPAYKGWCAYAMAENGKLVDVDPKSFKVINDKTYLFYDGFWGDTLKKWNKAKDDTGQIKSADKMWNAKHQD